MKWKPQGVWNGRMDIILRIVAAIFGGYAFTYAATAALARVLPFSRFDAVMTASLLSFAIYTAVVMWCFAVHSAARAWLGIGFAIPLYLIGFIGSQGV